MAEPEVRALHRSDLIKIKPDDDDRAQGYYVMTVSGQAVNVKGEWHVVAPEPEAGNRTTPLPAWITPTIDAHLKANVEKFPQSLLFPATRGEFLKNSSIDRPWRDAREHAGIGEDM